MPQSKRTTVYLFGSLLLIFALLPAWADDPSKDEQTLGAAAIVLQQMLEANSVPADLLAKADCVVILPSVKKGAFIVGETGGRGPMTCRGGANFSGKWSPPAMYSIGGTSVGLQVGGTASDFVLLVMAPRAVDKMLDGKSKLGSDMTAAAGPGATSTGSVGGADILTYGRASGLFAGVSLSGSSLSPDDETNKRLYGTAVSARDIVLGGKVKTTPGGRRLVSMLDTKVPTHSN
jgi:SH3 domain-containing YSC84-like protein 1